MIATQEGRVGDMVGKELPMIPHLQPKEPGEVEELPNSLSKLYNMLVYIKQRNMFSNCLKVCTGTLE